MLHGQMTECILMASQRALHTYEGKQTLRSGYRLLLTEPSSVS
jgi:hypothetical protein